MRPASVHDLIVTSAIVVGCCLAVIVLQIVIITKSTIPADAVITELRICRNEVANDHNTVAQRLADIDALLDLQNAKTETLKSMESHSGLSTN